MHHSSSSPCTTIKSRRKSLSVWSGRIADGKSVRRAVIWNSMSFAGREGVSAQCRLPSRLGKGFSGRTAVHASLPDFSAIEKTAKSASTREENTKSKARDEALSVPSIMHNAQFKSNLVCLAQSSNNNRDVVRRAKCIEQLFPLFLVFRKEFFRRGVARLTTRAPA